MHLLGDAEQVLHVMPDLVGDDVRLGKLTGRLELLRKLLEEAQVEIHLAVYRAVERARGRASPTAGGPHLIPVKHQLRWNVLHPLILENGAPGILGLAEHRGDEAALLILRRAVARRRRRLLRRYCAQQTKEQTRIDAEEVGSDQR